jgi:hypothetical protein
MSLLITDTFVCVPSEAIKYIEDRVGGYNTSPLLFEVVESFFEWLSVQQIDKQKVILKKLLETGRVNADIFSVKV